MIAYWKEERFYLPDDLSALNEELNVHIESIYDDLVDTGTSGQIYQVKIGEETLKIEVE